MRYTSTIPSRYFEDSTVCYVLILTYILRPVEHMHKIMNSNQTGRGHRKRVGEGYIFKSPYYVLGPPVSLAPKRHICLFAASLGLHGI